MEKGMRPIPLNVENKSKLVEILTQETTVFSMFVPLTKIPEKLCPIPENFLHDLIRQVGFFHKKGMQYGGLQAKRDLKVNVKYSSILT